MIGGEAETGGPMRCEGWDLDYVLEGGREGRGDDVERRKERNFVRDRCCRSKKRDSTMGDECW